MCLFVLDLELVGLPKYSVEARVSRDYLTTKSAVIWALFALFVLRLCFEVVVMVRCDWLRSLSGPLNLKFTY